MGVQAAACWAVILLGPIEAGRWASDQFNYHEPTIRLFAERLPGVDLSDYGSATTPGYHLVLAGLLAALEPLLGPGREWLMLAGSVFTLGVVGLASRLLIVRAGVRTGVALTLPLMASLYVFPAGVWLLPDAAGWLGVLAVLAVALHARSRARLLVLGGTLLVPLVLVRQVHLWAAAVVWTAAWLGPERGADAPGGPGFLGRPASQIRDLFAQWPARAGWMALAILSSLPAFAVVGWFVATWQGLVPPRFQGAYHGANPATPALTLSVAGLLTPAVLPFAWPGLKRLWCGAPGLLVGIAAAGLVAAVVPETTFDPEAGRISGIWTIAARLPELGGRTSPVVVLLAPVGALAVGGLLAGLDTRSGWVLAGALLAFVAAQSATHEAWQRYHEPFLLLWMALAAATGVRVRRERPSAASLAFPLAVAAAMGLATGLRIASEDRLPRLEPDALERALDADPLDGRPPAPAKRRGSEPAATVPAPGQAPASAPPGPTLDGSG